MVSVLGELTATTCDIQASEDEHLTDHCTGMLEKWNGNKAQTVVLVNTTVIWWQAVAADDVCPIAGRP